MVSLFLSLFLFFSRLRNGETSSFDRALSISSSYSPSSASSPSSTLTVASRHLGSGHKYNVRPLTRPSSCPPASVYNYVWYCNIGAARFGWWAVFILRAEMLLLYHSSSADIPETERRRVLRQVGGTVANAQDRFVSVYLHGEKKYMINPAEIIVNFSAPITSFIVPTKDQQQQFSWLHWERNSCKFIREI